MHSELVGFPNKFDCTSSNYGAEDVAGELDIRT